MLVASRNNFAIGSLVSASQESDAEPPAVIASPDFSSCYRSAVDGSITFTFSIAQQRKYGYVAIGGSNVAKFEAIDIVLGGARFGYQLNKNENSTLFFRIPEHEQGLGSPTVTIKIYGSGDLFISNVAFGDVHEIEYGLPAGYKKPWTVPNAQSRSATNLQYAPISLTYESRPIAITLSLPNIKLWQAGSFYDFVNFATTAGVFYISEDENITHSYACFNAEFNPVETHSQSPMLGNSSIKFNAYAKVSRFV